MKFMFDKQRTLCDTCRRCKGTKYDDTYDCKYNYARLELGDALPKCKYYKRNQGSVTCDGRYKVVTSFMENGIPCIKHKCYIRGRKRIVTKEKYENIKQRMLTYIK